NYATAINSGQSGDLIFPGKYLDIQQRSTSYDYWGDQYISEGLYMDLSPYLAQFCPEAIVNFTRYPQIKELCTKEGKTDAIYAGMPDINALSLFVKNSVLEENNIVSINNFDMLFEVMHNTVQRHTDVPDSGKILVGDESALLDYVIYKNGYYTLYNNSLTKRLSHIVLKQDDVTCKPYLIEDTDLLQNFFKEFSRFIEHSYFTTSSKTPWAKEIESYDFFLVQDPLFRIKDFTKQLTEFENILKDYSVFLFEETEYVANSPNSIILVIVPSTSNQPEKALHFMNWLMTDQDAADVLTFGSNVLNMKHYRYSEDGTIIPEKNNLIYGYYNLVANFSDKAFLWDNKEYDISKTYKEMAYKATIPPLYKKLAGQHIHLDAIQNLYLSRKHDCDKRNIYVKDTIREILGNPESLLTPDHIEKELFYITDSETLI
ncbi:MAG TPA: hypothetical protein DDZ89_09500, partial [Clostridiales bacterium]|nr:hypothetical protein [Clostridiales bacterium]